MDIRQRLLGWVKNQLDAPTQLKAGPQLEKRTPLRRQIKTRTFRIELRMKSWRDAVMTAEDDLNPRRQLLYLLYHTAMEDAELLEQVRTARFNVQLASFDIMQDGEPNEDLKKLFITPWFHDYLQHAVDSEIYGHSLIEFVKKDKEGFFDQIYLIPREHVRPEPQFRDVLIEPSDMEGVPFDEGPWARQLVEIGTPYDLGLLKSISKLVIKKEYNFLDWGIRNEKYGMPFLVVKTASRDEEELDAKEEMAANFGSNGYAILDDMDEIELKEAVSNTGGGHLTFKDFVETVDGYIARLINGQTGTSDEKAYVGSAEVHERTMNRYTLARMRRIQNHINFQLIPFLVKNGYPLANAEFEFADLRENEDTTMTVDQDPDAEKKSSRISNSD